MNCTTEKCNGKILAKGLCTKCYYRVKRGGTALVSKKQQQSWRICSIEGCNKSHHSNSYCAMHNKRYKLHGDPNFINPKCNRDGNAQERNRARTSKWKKDNWDYYKPFLAARKSRVKQATPSWANIKQIEEFYRNCPKGYHVDHIEPLNGKDRSGLHVIWNLQYLPAIENLRKSNKV